MTHDPALEIVRRFEGGALSRRQLITHLMALGAATGAAGPVLAASSRRSGHGRAWLDSTFTARSVDHVALRVTEVARSRAFYEKHLGLTLMSDGGENSCFLRCGKDFLALFRARDGRAGMDHFCFALDDYEAGDAVKRLEAAGLEPRRHGNRVYFDDPDGIEVQVASPSES